MAFAVKSYWWQRLMVVLTNVTMCSAVSLKHQQSIAEEKVVKTPYIVFS
jgi:hypothetical protein